MTWREAHHALPLPGVSHPLTPARLQGQHPLRDRRQLGQQLPEPNPVPLLDRTDRDSQRPTTPSRSRSSLTAARPAFGSAPQTAANPRLLTLSLPAAYPVHQMGPLRLRRSSLRNDHHCRSERHLSPFPGTATGPNRGFESELCGDNGVLAAKH